MSSKKTKSALLAVVVGALIAILLSVLGINTVILFVIVLGASIIGGVIGLRIFKDEIIRDIKADLKKEKVVLDTTGKVIESLIALEEFIALADTPLEAGMSSKVSSIIESLIEVVPTINDEYSTQTITFEVTNMAEEHFPNRIKVFMKLNSSDRENQSGKLLADLENMEKTIQRVTDVINNDSLNRDERESILNDIKYGAI